LENGTNFGEYLKEIRLSCEKAEIEEIELERFGTHLKEK
jgi:hypothetical protein